jgi:trigger factor
MQVTETIIDALTREYRVALPAADLQERLEQRLNELARTANLKGFRPGKVPVEVLRRKFGASLRAEVVEQAVSESSATVIEERGLRPALSPRLEIGSFDEGGDLTYTMAVELLPEITAPNFGDIRLERLVVDVGDEEVDTSIGRLARALAPVETVTEPRPAAAGDIAVVDFAAGAEPLPVPGDGRDVPVEVGASGNPPGLGDQLAGLSVGDSRNVTLVFPEDYPIAGLAGGSHSYTVTLKEIRRQEPIPVDDAMAKRFGLETLDALRATIREQREGDLKSLSRLRLKRALLDRLADLYDFDIPKGLVDREYRDVVAKMAQDTPAGADAHEHTHGHGSGDPEHVHDETCGHDHAGVEHVHDETCGHDHEHDDHAADAALTEAQRQDCRRLAERRVRLGLVLAEIGRQNNLRVSPEELGKAIGTEARRYPGQEQSVFEFFRKNAAAREALGAPILEDKIVDFILELADVGERKVTFEELLRDDDRRNPLDPVGDPNPTDG